MVITKVVYQCGCGFKSDSKEPAVEHVRKTGHTLTVYGTIFETEEKPKSR